MPRGEDGSGEPAGGDPVSVGPSAAPPGRLDALVRQELGPDDARELTLLKEQVQRDSGLQFGSYKDKCLRRRLAVRMRACGVHRFGDYARILREEPKEYRRLRAAVTINVSKFFRNADVWDALGQRVLPALFALDEPEIRIWSAGTAAGEEAYTLSILLLEYAAEHGLEAELDRFRILATDLDGEALKAARRGEYGDNAVGEIPDAIRARWFEPGPPWRLRSEVKARVRFERADLLTAAFPTSRHLIVCRNVIIYLARHTQEPLLRRFHEALAPGGFLVLGKVETLLRPVGGLFEPVESGARIYRRP